MVITTMYELSHCGYRYNDFYDFVIFKHTHQTAFNDSKLLADSLWF